MNIKDTMNIIKRTETDTGSLLNFLSRMFVCFGLTLLAISVFVAGCGGSPESPPPATGVGGTDPVKTLTDSKPARIPDKTVNDAAASALTSAGELKAPAAVASTSGTTVETTEPVAVINPLVTEPERMLLPEDFVLYRKAGLKETRSRKELASSIEKGYFLSLLQEDPGFSEKVWANESQLLARSYQKQLLKLKYDPTQEEVISVFESERTVYTRPDGKILREPTLEIADSIRTMLQMKKWQVYVISEFDRLVANGSVKFAPQILKFVGGAASVVRDPLAGLDPGDPMIEFGDPALGKPVTVAQMRDMAGLYPVFAGQPGMAPGQPESLTSLTNGDSTFGMAGPGAAGPGTSAVSAGAGNYNSIERLARLIVGLRITIRDGEAHNLPKDAVYRELLPDLYLERFLDQYRGAIETAKASAVTAEELKAHYSANIEKYTPRPIMNLNWLTFDTEEEALAAMARVRGGMNFEDLVKERLGIEAIKTLNVVEEGIKETVLEAIKGIRPGEISPVIATEGKFVLVQYLHREERRPYNFEIVRDQVREDVAYDRAAEARDKVLAKLRVRALDVLMGKAK